MNDEVYVVAISGMSGAGKSRVVKRTVELLGNACALHFDHFDSVSEYPPDLKDWLDRGADMSEWKTPQFADAISKLRRREAVQLPGKLGILQPADYVIVEEPFGKTRPETSELIHLAIHLHAPADILLTRRLLRRIEEERQFHDNLVNKLHEDLSAYLMVGRELITTGCEMVRDLSDLVLDSTATVDTIAERVVEEIRIRRGRQPDAPQP